MLEYNYNVNKSWDIRLQYQRISLKVHFLFFSFNTNEMVSKAHVRRNQKSHARMEKQFTGHTNLKIFSSVFFHRFPYIVHRTVVD